MKLSLQCSNFIVLSNNPIEVITDVVTTMFTLICK